MTRHSRAHKRIIAAGLIVAGVGLVSLSWPHKAAAACDGRASTGTAPDCVATWHIPDHVQHSSGRLVLTSDRARLHVISRFLDDSSTAVWRIDTLATDQGEVASTLTLPVSHDFGWMPVNFEISPDWQSFVLMCRSPTPCLGDETNAIQFATNTLAQSQLTVESWKDLGDESYFDTGSAKSSAGHARTTLIRPLDDIACTDDTVAFTQAATNPQATQMAVAIHCSFQSPAVFAVVSLVDNAPVFALDVPDLVAMPPAWSADGEWLVIASHDGDQTRISVFDMEE